MRATRCLALFVLVGQADAESKSCESHPSCTALGLSGECCPTGAGILLDCCGSTPSLQASPPQAAPPLPAPLAMPRPSSSPQQSSPSTPPQLSPPPRPPYAPGVALLGVASLGSKDLGKLSKAAPHPQQPSAAWGSASAPLPTNEWWQNLVLEDGGVLGADVVSTLPYLLKAGGDGLHACLPQSKLATADYVTVPFEDTITFGAAELSRSSAYTIAAHDPLSVTVVWRASNGESGKGEDGSMSTPLVRGMPYVSATYSGLTPQMSFAASPIAKINGKAPPVKQTASRFDVELASGRLSSHALRSAPLAQDEGAFPCPNLVRRPLESPIRCPHAEAQAPSWWQASAGSSMQERRWTSA